MNSWTDLIITSIPSKQQKTSDYNYKEGKRLNNIYIVREKVLTTVLSSTVERERERRRGWKRLKLLDSDQMGGIKTTKERSRWRQQWQTGLTNQLNTVLMIIEITDTFVYTKESSSYCRAYH